MDTKRVAKLAGVAAALVIGAGVVVGVARTQLRGGSEDRSDRRSKGTWQRVK